MKQTTKGQIQIGESIFVVIFIMIIIILGLVFYSSGEEESFQRKEETFLQLSSISLAQYATSLKELQCSQLEVEELSCLDKIRLDSFVNLTENHWDLAGEHYVNQLGTALIIAEEIYPDPQTWIIYNYTFNLTETAFTARQINLPTKLFNSVTGKYSFGVLYITKYDRK